MFKKKHKYRFNPHLLTYEKVIISIKDIFLKVLSYVAIGLVFSTIVIIIAYNFLDSPKERMLRREIKQYEQQYDLLNERLNTMSAVLKDIQDRDDDIYRVIFEADPIPVSIRNAGYGGANRYNKLEGYKNTEIIKESALKLDKIARQLYVQSKSFDEVFEMAKNKNKMLSSIPAIQPVSKKISNIFSGFGYRIHPIYKYMHMHTGIDITAHTGTPVYATGDGVIMSTQSGYIGYGIVCVINHGYNYKTLYGHLSRLIVKPGQQVKRGQVIGYVGSTGVSTGPHLHYEVRFNDRPVNPVNYFYNDLTPEEYQKVIEISSRVNQSLS